MPPRKSAPKPTAQQVARFPDSSTQYLAEDLQFLYDCLRAAEPDPTPWLPWIDASVPQRLPRTKVTSWFKEFEHDVALRVCWSAAAPEPVRPGDPLILHGEQQASLEPELRLRIVTYAALVIWLVRELLLQELRSDHAASEPAARLRDVAIPGAISLLIFTGEHRPRPESLELRHVPELLRPNQPQNAIVLLDVPRLTEEALARTSPATRAVLRVWGCAWKNAAATEAALIRSLADLATLPPAEDFRWEHRMHWLVMFVGSERPAEEHARLQALLEEAAIQRSRRAREKVNEMVGSMWDQLRREGREEGREEGVGEGVLQALRQVFESRLGPIPAEWEARIAAGDAAWRLALLEQVMHAESVSELRVPQPAVNGTHPNGDH